MKVKKNSIVIRMLIILAIVGIFFASNQFTRQQDNVSITSFDECVKAGNPVMESNPPRCRTADGVTFTGNIPQSVRVKGEVVCLPHKDTSGPVTLECAYGLKGINGKFYALLDTDPEYKNISSLPTGEVAVITGKFTEQLDSEYDIVGVIEIELVEK